MLKVVPQQKIHEIHKETDLEKMWLTFCDGIIGQEDVKTTFRPYFDSIFYKNRLGKPSDTTYGAFLLCGPTGVGKGEFARSLAQTLHSSSRNLLTINCGEFAAQHEVARLLGAPPGYLGHRETQALLSQSRINSVSSDQSVISIILWDEIEKAHPDIFKPILSILDRANLRLGDNNLVNCDKTLHIFTSNLGNKYEADSNTFLLKETLSTDYKQKQQKGAINKHFKKEFLGRMTANLFFKSFDHSELRQLFDLEVEKLFHVPCCNALDFGIRIESLEATKAVSTRIIELSNTEEFGARELTHQINKTIGIMGLAKLYSLCKYSSNRGSYILKFDYKKDKFSCEAIILDENNEN